MRSIKLPSWIESLLGLNARAAPPHVFALLDDALCYARFKVDATRAGGRAVPVFSLRRELPAEVIPKGPLGGAIRDHARFQSFLEEFLSNLPEPVSEASLVLPDAWLRMIFVETSELPRSERAWDEALRWKLKQQVPYRVEDLRVRGLEVPALAEQDEPRRLLLGFGAEPLLAGLEANFASAHVRIGHISNLGASFAEAVSDGDGGEAFLWGSAVGYSVMVMNDGEPVIYRSKRLEPGLDANIVRGMVEREVALTLAFLAQRAPSLTLRRIVVLGTDGSPGWLEAVRGGVARSAVTNQAMLTLKDLIPADLAQRIDFSGLSQGPGELSWTELLPLFGAARREVA